MHLTPKQFKVFSELVYQESGINLHDGKLQLLQARLAKRLRHTQIESVDDYLKCIESDPQELLNFIDAVSTNHTYFFRESHHFDFLQSEYATIWCAASSSGEEPYSLAIACMEKGFRPTILATDISLHVLQTAQRGIYPIERAKNIPQSILKKYFQKGQGKWGRHIRIKPEIQRLVTFKRFNLLTDTVPSQTYDTIFCRNVLIYFDNPTKETVVNKLHGALKLNGFFIIGGAESLNNIHHKYKYIRPSIYKRTSA